MKTLRERKGWRRLAALMFVIALPLTLASPGSTARAEWTYVNLNPAGATNGSALFGVADGQQVGIIEGPGPVTAAVWSGTAGSYVNLNPPASFSSSAHGVSQGRQVGQLVLPGVNGHAAMWSGAANSYVDLQPAGMYFSEALGIRGNQQVGYVVLEPAISHVYHASLWSGTAASWVDLLPTGAVNSIAYGVDANQQVGSVTPSSFGSHGHASLWTGTAASWVDLEPAPAPGVFPIVASVANAVHGGQQVGTITYRLPDGTLIDHAGYWSGTAASWVDLTPDSTNLFAVSRADGVFGGYQVGQVETSSDVHAAIWHGTPESYVDLGSLLPANYVGSNAFGVWTDGQTIQVAGVAYNNTLGRSEAILWTNTVPEPGSILAVLVGAILLRPRRRRVRSDNPGVFRHAAVAIVVASAAIAAATPSASASPPTFTSAVELLTPEGTPANADDVETSRIHPVSAGFGAAGTYGGAVRWAADGSATLLSTPAGYGSTYIRAMGINDGGQVVGIASPGKAVRWDANGVPTLLNGAGAESYGTGANGINNLGQVVGEDYGGMPNGEVGAIRWAADGSAMSLGQVSGHVTTRSVAYNISDAGQAVGYARFADVGDRAVRWDAGGAATLLGVVPGQGGYSIANGVNDAGQVVGEALFAGGTLAVRWGADGSGTRLGDLPGHDTQLSQAWGVTDGGLVGGYAYLADLGDLGANRAVIWDAGGAPSMLQDLMADGNAWTFTSVEGIDANTTTLRVLAIGSRNGGPFNYYLVDAAVPEPAGFGLLLLMALALLVPRRQRCR